MSEKEHYSTRFSPRVHGRMVFMLAFASEVLVGSRGLFFMIPACSAQTTLRFRGRRLCVFHVLRFVFGGYVAYPKVLATRESTRRRGHGGDVAM